MTSCTHCTRGISGLRCCLSPGVTLCEACARLASDEEVGRHIADARYHVRAILAVQGRRRVITYAEIHATLARGGRQ